MKFKRSVLLSSCVFAFTWILARAEAPGVQLVRQSDTGQINPLDEQLNRSMRWSHGAYFVTDKIGGQPPVVYSLNREGVWTTTAHFQNPKPTQFDSFSFDRQGNGTIVFSGQFETAPRAASPFLAWISSDGKSQRIFPTEPYFPYRIAVAPDDTIWTLGYEMVNLNDLDPAVNQEARVLRHFDKAGKLIESAFPQSQFNKCGRFRLAHSLLVATRDRVGWYGPQQDGATYTEISLDTMTMKGYPGASSGPSKSKLPVGLAMTDSGAVSLCVQNHSPATRTNYVFHRASSTWVPVSVPSMGGVKYAPLLIGSDGDNLVFKAGREAGFFSVLQ